EVVTPMVRAYGWPFLVLSSVGIAVATADLFRMTPATADLPPSPPEGASASLAEAFGGGGKVRTTPGTGRSAPVALLVWAILLQAAALYVFARSRGNDPYMARKMFYLLLFPQAVGVAIAVGTAWKKLRPARNLAAWAVTALVAAYFVRPL